MQRNVYFMIHTSATTASRAFRSPHRAFIVSIAFALLIGGCASMSPEEEARYELNKMDRYVKLEAIEPGAARNDHPYTIPAPQLQSVLAGLSATGNLSLGDEAAEVFTGDEAAEIAGPIAAALARATPQQDVIFQSAGARGLFGRFSVPSHTTGRVFVADGQLNLILGQVHQRIDPDVGEQYRPQYAMATRSHSLESGWRLTEESGRRAADRNDWIRLPLSVVLTTPAAAPSIPAATSQSETTADTPADDAPADTPTAIAPSSSDPVQQRAQEFENRLRVLDDLKARGLISDEEYRQRRALILDGI